MTLENPARPPRDVTRGPERSELGIPQADVGVARGSDRRGADVPQTGRRAHDAPWQIRHGAAILYLGTDALAAALGVVVAREAAWALGLAFVVVIVLNQAAGLYRGRISLSILDDVPRLVAGVLAAGTMGALATALADPSITGTFFRGLAVLLVAMLVMRAIAYAGTRRLRRSRRFGHPALILGAGVVGQALADAIVADPGTGLRFVGFIDDEPLGVGDLPGPVLGGAADLPDVIVDRGIAHVIIAFFHLPESQLVSAVRTCDRLECEISVVPRLFELSARSRDGDALDGMSLTRLRRAPFRTPMWHMKRVMDLLTAAVAVVVLSPLIALIALAVRIVDGPGVIFRQERVGLDGTTFQLLKFRTLAPVDEAESETRWNVKGDERISWLGRFLRTTSLDELPQLWNVVRGDMSLVGPRPERPHFVEYFDELLPRYGARLRVPSGVTGWAQIHGLRGDTSIEERARYDNWYIENWSLWLDFKILVLTVGSLMRGSG